jgi:hypothetical protein
MNVLPRLKLLKDMKTFIPLKVFPIKSFIIKNLSAWSLFRVLT